MKLSQVIKTLQQAKKDFGDIQAFLVDPEDGNHRPIREIIKTFPYHPSSGLDRSASVLGIVICDYGKNAPDLVFDHGNFWKFDGNIITLFKPFN